MTLRYRSDQEIKIGDHVLFHGNPATVEIVAYDSSDPEMKWYLEEFGGGVVILDPTVSGRTFIPAQEICEYEDLEYVARADSSNLTRA